MSRKVKDSGGGANFQLIKLVACTSNPATLVAEVLNGMSSVPLGGNSPSIGG